MSVCVYEPCQHTRLYKLAQIPSSFAQLLLISIQCDLSQLQESLFFETITKRGDMPNSFIYMFASQNACVFNSIALYTQK